VFDFSPRQVVAEVNLFCKELTFLVAILILSLEKCYCVGVKKIEKVITFVLFL
jgi:hypothetical protein